MELTGLHVAGMSSMLLLPALITAHPAVSFLAAGTVTAAAALLTWGASSMWNRQAVFPSPDLEDAADPAESAR